MIQNLLAWFIPIFFFYLYSQELIVQQKVFYKNKPDRLFHFISQHQEKFFTLNDSSNDPRVMNFIDHLAEKYRDFSRERLIRLFKQVNLQGPLQTRISNQLYYPPEKVKSWESYRDQFVNPQRIAAGIEFYLKHQNLFNEISKQFSVPTSIILATLGLESHFGKVKYRYPVFSSLVMNSFVNGQREKFYLEQLEYFLLWAHHNHYEDKKILDIYGSYSGAIGPAQFIPFSIYHYGHDFNRDGKIDMQSSHSDVLASIANYYKKNGWNNKKKVINELSLPCEVGENILFFVDGDDKPRCWKKGHNYKVILTYNRNDFYAQALYLLSLKMESEINQDF